MKTLIVDENMPAIEQLFAGYDVSIQRRAGRTLSAADLIAADALLVRSVTSVNQTLLEGSAISFVGSATIGTDHVDLPYLEQQQIRFANSPGCNAESVVDYVLSSFAALYHEQGFEWWQKTIAVVGCGIVGGRLVKRLNALGINVVAYDPPKANREADFESADWQEVLAADVICIHTPLINDGAHATRHLFDASALNSLKAGCVLLNAGRGAVVDNTALLPLLKQNSVTAILDVFEFEPSPSLELINHCFIATPHIAGYSLDGKIRGSEMVYQALCKHFNWPVHSHKVQGDFAAITQMQVEHQSDWVSLNRLISRSFDVRADDGRMRRSFATSTQYAQSFDLLRKCYVERREFSTIKVTPNCDLFIAAGFQCESD